MADNKWNGENPWMGLAPYTEGTTLYGRSEECSVLSEIIKNNIASIVFGKSGIGKSSLLSAGISPLLRDENCIPIRIRLVHNTDVSYAEQIKRAVRENIMCEDQLQTSFPEFGLWDFFHRHIFYSHNGDRCIPVIVLDQFEEIYTLTDSEHKNSIIEFFAEVSSLMNDIKPDAVVEYEKTHSTSETGKEEAANAKGLILKRSNGNTLRYIPENNFRFVVCLREDKLYLLERNSANIPSFKTNRYNLRALSPQSAIEVIMCPRPDLFSNEEAMAIVDKIADVGEEGMRTIDPAILSLFLYKYFEKQGATNYDNIFAEYYRESTEGIKTKSIAFLENHLLTLGGYRNQIPLDDAIESGVSRYDIKKLLEKVILRTEKRKDIDYIEFSHDRLCEEAKRSRDERNITLQKRVTRNRMMIGGCIITVLCILGFYLYCQNREIKISLTKAIAEKIINLSSNDSYLASLLSLELIDTYPYTIESEIALRLASSKTTGILLGHTEETTTASFSSDDKYIASGSWDGMIIIWDAKSGAKLQELTPFDYKDEGIHTQKVFDISYSPDGKYIAAAYYDGIIRIWNMQSYKMVRELKGHESLTVSVSYSHNGKFIASGAWDKTIRLWNAQNGQEIGILKGHTKDIKCVSWSPDDNYLVSASADGTLKIWNIATKKEEKKLVGHDGYVMSACYSANGKWIVSGSEDRTIKIWDIEKGEPIKTFKGHERLINSVSLSHDNKYILSSSNDMSIRIWDIDKGFEIKKLEGHTDKVKCAKFNSNDNYIVSASHDRSIHVWDMKKEKKHIKVLDIDRSAHFATFSPNNEFIVTSSHSGNVVLWSLKSHSMIRDFSGLRGDIYCTSFSHSGKYLVAGSSVNEIAIWNINSSIPIRVIKGHDQAVTKVFFSPDDKFIVSSSWDNTIRLWNANTGDSVHVLRGHTQRILSASYSPNGKYIVSASADSTIRIWDIVKNETVVCFRGHEDYVISAYFSKDGKRIVSSSKDGTIRIWDVFKKKEILCIRQKCAVYSASFSPDDKYIVGASYDGIIYVWDTQTGNVIETYECQTNFYDRIAYTAFFSPTGKEIVASYNDGVRIWEFCSLQELINKTRTQFKDRKLSVEERKKYLINLD